MRAQAALLLYSVYAQRAFGLVWCSFYEHGDCTGVKSIAFDASNDGCFKAAGKSMKCDITETPPSPPAIKLVQSPNNGIKCNCQNHCKVFPNGADHCINLNSAGFNSKFHTYRFISADEPKCDPNNCNKRDLGYEFDAPWEQAETDE